MSTDKTTVPTLHEIPIADMLRAREWRQKHAINVAKVTMERESGNPTYPPSGSDLRHPELWRAPHWRWFNGVWP